MTLAHLTDETDSMNGQNQPSQTYLSAEATRASFLAEAADTIAVAETDCATDVPAPTLEQARALALALSRDRVQLAIGSALHSIATDLHTIAMRPPTTGLGSRS